MRGVHARVDCEPDTELLRIARRFLITAEMGAATRVGRRLAAALDAGAASSCLGALEQVYLAIFLLCDGAMGVMEEGSRLQGGAGAAQESGVQEGGAGSAQESHAGSAQEGGAGSAKEVGTGSAEEVGAGSERLIAAQPTTPASFYAPYYACLPPPAALRGSPLFWTPDELAWLAGSYVRVEVEERRASIVAEYAAVCAAAPRFAAVASQAAWSWARAIVSSRNFSLVLDGVRTQVS